MRPSFLFLACWCVVFGAACSAASGDELQKSANETWYPKAIDSCTTFNAEVGTHGYPNLLANPEFFYQDRAVAKLRSDLDAILHTDPSEKYHFILGLSTYCDSHGTTLLGGISASDIVNYLKGNKAASSNNYSETDYQAAVTWYNSTIKSCGSDTECKMIATSYRNHVESCYKGDQQACADIERDRKDWSSRGNATTTLKDPMTQCLQDTLSKVVGNCRQTNCPKDSLLDTIRYAQQAQCGYSAIEPIRPQTIQPVQPSNPTTSDCISRPRPGGGFTTECIQY